MKSKIHILIFLNHMIALLALGTFSVSKNLPLVILGLFLFGKVGGEIGFHRYLAHRSFQTGFFRRNLMIFLGCMNCFGSPISWILIHRMHHNFSDTELDPHGGTLPWWRVWLTSWSISKVNKRLITKEMKQSDLRWYHQHYFKIVFIIYGLCAYFSIESAAFFISVPAVLTFHSAGLVNVICHRFGYRRYDTEDSSVNNLFVNFFTLGSGLHNNHHQNPQSPYCSKRWYEFDLPGILIRYIFRKGGSSVARVSS